MTFRRHDVNGLTYFTIPSFDNTGLVRHLFSTRVGGIKERGGPIELSLGPPKVGLRRERIRNFKRLCDVTGVDVEGLILAHQVHGTTIKEVDTKDRGKGIWRASDIRNTDGFITAQGGLTLVTFHADCVPLYFLDPKSPAIGLAHAGWKGTISGIAKKTVMKMEDAFNTEPRDILVGIGPSICKDCYEVDGPVIDELRRNFKHWQEVTRYLGKDKYLLDLQQTNKRILCKAGVKEENITDSGLCTRCNPGLFYSYRGEGRDTGSLAAFIGLEGGRG